MVIENNRQEASGVGGSEIMEVATIGAGNSGAGDMATGSLPVETQNSTGMPEGAT